MATMFKASVETPHGPRRCVQAVKQHPGRKPLIARFGGIPLRRRETARIADISTIRGNSRPKELVTRLLAGRCELCKATDSITVHHVSRPADLTTRRQPHPIWVTAMLKRRRKTLVVCRACHATIHTETAAEHG
jgi:hypothetical protein